MTTWTRETVDTSLERRIVTGLIISDRVLRRLALAYRPRFMTVPYMTTVCKWVMEYQAAYDKAPGRHITDLYEAHRRNGLDPDISEMIGRFLASISEEYEGSGLNEEYLTDQALSFFKERSLVLLKEDLEGHISQGNLLGAEEAVARWSSPGSGISLGCEPMRDMQAIRDALSGDDELFTLPGALGRLLGPFVSEDAWGLVGNYKAGKSYMVQHIQLMALYAGLNVARFSFEMNRRKETRRFIQGIAGVPLRPPDGPVWWPVWDCKLNQEGNCSRVERINRMTLMEKDGLRPHFSRSPQGYRACAACRGRDHWQMETWAEAIDRDVPTWRAVWKRAQAVGKQLRGARFKFQYWPMRTAGVAEVRSTLEVWAHLEGFIPHVIIVDSPDLQNFRGEDRMAIVKNRQDNVALAQQYHSLLVMPFQAGSKAAIERKAKKDSDVGESVQILGDVDGMVVMDRSREEEQMLRCRVGTSVQRDDRRGSHIMVLQCLELGQAVVDSEFIRENQ